MRNWILMSYNRPYSYTYQFFTFLDRYFYAIILSVSVAIIAYPLSRYSYLYYSIQEKSFIEQQLHQDLDKQQKLLASLHTHLNQNNQNQSHFSEINQHIQNILNQYQVSAENWQWILEKKPKLHLTIKYNSQTLINIINEINKIPNLYSQEIILNKLHRGRLIEMNAIFILSI